MTDTRMHDAELDFIESMGVLSEEDGLPRIAGRILGLLLLREGPFNLDDLTEQLQVSKTSASTNARLLERSGIAERVSRPGDRKDFYRLAPDAPARSFERTKAQMVRRLKVIDDTIHRLPRKRHAERGRLEDNRRWHAFIVEELDGLMERWAERRKRYRARDPNTQDRR